MSAIFGQTFSRMTCPMSSRPLQVSADHKRREAWQRRAVRARDNKNGQPCCRLEILTSSGWKECGKKSASDTVHILPRRQCSELWSHEDVALLGCRECHNALDGQTIGDATLRVRVPYARARAAWKLVVANTKVPPPARYNPDVNEDYEDIRVGGSV
jgi:5-methylcytosine-specific restriction endonuclease McrA